MILHPRVDSCANHHFIQGEINHSALAFLSHGKIQKSPIIPEGMVKAIFLDRDGTLIEDPGYAFKPEQFQLLPGVIEGLRRLQEEYLFFIITNQSGIERGYYTEAQFRAYNQILLDELSTHGITIQKTYFCPHIAGCDCKKPNPKFIFQAVKEFGGIDLPNSWTIGDHDSDVQLGFNAGCKGIYILTGHGRHHLGDLEDRGIAPTFIAENFSDAVDYIVASGK